MGRPIIDLTGRMFGRLTAIEKTDKRNGGKIVWRCLCSCGKTHFVEGCALRRGKCRSCGCLRIDLLMEMRPKIVCPVSAARLEEIYKDGASLNAIASQFSVCRDTVGRWIDDFGIERRHVSEVYRLKLLRNPNHLAHMVSHSLATRAKLTAAGLMPAPHLHTPDAERKRLKSYRETIAARRAKQQADREQAEAIERSLNGDTFK